MSVTPVLVCHRGASALAPENSLEAFRVAMAYGVDFSELDVHVGRSGDLVVTHDAVPDVEAERGLPRLAEVFDLVRGKMGIYVELKGERTGRALGELVRAGALRTVPGSGAVRYECVGGERHDHFRCTSCGRLYDVHVRGHEALALVEEGYAVDRASIVLEGRCPACAGA